MIGSSQTSARLLGGGVDPRGHAKHPPLMGSSGVDIKPGGICTEYPYPFSVFAKLFQLPKGHLTVSVRQEYYSGLRGDAREILPRARIFTDGFI